MPGSAPDEEVTVQSPAQFFAENQNIAGFDNAGKALFTTIRELVENSLDACEALGRLPDILVTVEALTVAQLDELHGLATRDRRDVDLYIAKEGPGATAPRAPRGRGKYFRITCKDNGIGMAHAAMPEMLGRVLAGSKYGVRQTRGKFGLGAKMALIWSKKSSGLPIRVHSAYAGGKQRSADAASAAPPSPPPLVSHLVLDIDIDHNTPEIIDHSQLRNTEGFVGTELSLVIEGSWSTYRARIASYMKQLAVITPYADLRLVFVDSARRKEPFTLHHPRRSTMVLPHPYSLNLLSLRQLMTGAKGKTLLSFLTSCLQGVSKSIARRVVDELGTGFRADMPLHQGDGSLALSVKQLQHIAGLLRQVKLPAPAHDSLSPAGEYNLELGVLKELQPDMVATATAPPACVEGHACIVEAAVALATSGQGQAPGSSGRAGPAVGRQGAAGHGAAAAGDASGGGGSGAAAEDGEEGVGSQRSVTPGAPSARAVAAAAAAAAAARTTPSGGTAAASQEGITVHRFANRIPLLFEGGADVMTRTAHKDINWGAYKIRPTKQAVHVFVSVVSTRVPFKGTGKEYVAYDITEIQQAVKEAVEQCCRQLRARIMVKQTSNASQQRKRSLVRYVPDVAKAAYSLLQQIASGERAPSPGREDRARPRAAEEEEEGEEGTGAANGARVHRKRPPMHDHPLAKRARRGQVGEETLRASLLRAVERLDPMLAMETSREVRQSTRTVQDTALVPWRRACAEEEGDGPAPVSLRLPCMYLDLLPAVAREARARGPASPGSDSQSQ